MGQPEKKLSPPSTGALKIYWIICFLVLAGWLVLAYFIGPLLLRSAYSGHGFGSSLGVLLEGKDLFPFDYYQKLFSTFSTFSIPLLCVCFVLGHIAISHWPWTPRNLSTPMSARSLGITRFLLCGLSLALLFTEQSWTAARLPPEFWHGSSALAPLHAIPGFTGHVAFNPAALHLLHYAIALALTFGALGLYSRVSIGFAVVIWFVLGGIHREFTHFFHIGLLPLYLLTILCFTACGDGFSIDSLRGRIRLRSPAYYGACHWLLCFFLGLGYFLTGCSKIRFGGPNWWIPENLERIAAQDRSASIASIFDLFENFSSAGPWLYAVAGLVGLFGELFVLSIVFSRRARLIVPIFLVALHGGIYLMQGFLFLDALLIGLVIVPGNVYEKILLKTGWPFRSAGQPMAPASSLSSIRSLAAAIFLVVFGSWIFQIERFPLTAWQMYAGISRLPVARYTEIYYTDVLGNKTRTDLTDVFPALSQLRFRDLRPHFASASKSESQSKFNLLFHRIQEIRAQKELPALSRLEWVTYEWQFERDPSREDLSVKYRFVATNQKKTKGNRSGEESSDS